MLSMHGPICFTMCSRTLPRFRCHCNTTSPPVFYEPPKSEARARHSSHVCVSLQRTIRTYAVNIAKQKAARISLALAFLWQGISR